MAKLCDSISKGLGLSREAVIAIAARADHSYRRYEIAKRNGGVRVIYHPSRPLKAVQRWLLRCVMARWPVHEAARAYVRKRSIVDNARAHAGSKYLLRMDLADFFTSIDAGDILLCLQTVAPDWDNDDRQLFCKIVCMNGRLTIGAPTSPHLSNVACSTMDVRLSAIERGITYTRYADDMFFSATSKGLLEVVPDIVGRVLSQLPYPRGLRVNVGKTRHMSGRGRMVAAGIVLGSGGKIGVGRGRLRMLRSYIHKWSQLDGKKRVQVAGWIAHAAAVDRQLINRLILKYGPELIGRVRKGLA